MYLGSQLMVYDELGSRISHNLNYHSSPILSKEHLQYFLQHPNSIIRHISLTAISNTIIGRTYMTATGRAILIVGAFTGAAWLYNSHLDRKAANQRSNADRDVTVDGTTAQQAETAHEVAERLAAKARAYQNYQDYKKEYNNTPFYKSRGPKPQWDETKWETWSKTK